MHNVVEYLNAHPADGGEDDEEDGRLEYARLVLCRLELRYDEQRDTDDRRTKRTDNRKFLEQLVEAAFKARERGYDDITGFTRLLPCDVYEAITRSSLTASASGSVDLCLFRRPADGSLL